MAKVIGYDPNSFGLIYYGNRKPDNNYIPVERQDGLLTHVFNPLKFIKGQTTTNPHYKSIPDFRMFIRGVTTRGIVTNGESSNLDTRLVPIIAKENVEGGSPYAYAQELMNIAHDPLTEPPELKPWLLRYVADIQNFTEIRISELPDIDLTSGGNISVSSAGGGSLSFPLPFILDKNRHEQDQDVIRVEKISNYADGFRYAIRFAGQEVMSDYTTQPQQMAILDNQQNFMINDYNIDKQMKDITAFQIIPEIILDVFSGNMTEIFAMLSGTVGEIMDILGHNMAIPIFNASMDMMAGIDKLINPEDQGEWEKNKEPLREFTEEQADAIMRLMIIIGGFTDPKAIMDMFKEYFLYEARAEDRARQSTNVGGNVVDNMLNKEIDQLLTISYPVPNRIQTKTQFIYPKDFAENNTHTYAVNKVFNSVTDFLNYINEHFPGELLYFDGEPLINYGDYTSHFQKLISKGLLLI